MASHANDPAAREFFSSSLVRARLTRRGPASFLRERALRLGLPFVISAALLAPLACYPTWLQTGAQPAKHDLR